MKDLILKICAAARLAREKGQSITEYSMAVAMIALGCVAGEAAIAHGVNQTFIALATTITTGVLR